MTVRVAILALLAFAAGASADPKAATMSIGGGVSNYLDGSLNGSTGVGGAWDARFTIPARSWLSGELAYAGSAHFAGRGPGWTLLTHAVEASVRLNHVRNEGAFLIEPFVAAGIGYAFLMTGGSNSGGFGDVLLPIAAGISVIHDRLLVEGRFTYRHAFDGELVTKVDGTHGGLASWAATAALGYAF